MWGHGSVLKAVTTQAWGPKFVWLVPSQAHPKLGVIAHACIARAGEMEAGVSLGLPSQWVSCSMRDPVLNIREWKRGRVEENSSCWLLISHACGHTFVVIHSPTQAYMQVPTHKQTHMKNIYSFIDSYQEEIVVMHSARELVWRNTPGLRVSSFGPRQSVNEIPESFAHPFLILSQCSGLKNQAMESGSSSVLELDAQRTRPESLELSSHLPLFISVT